MESFDYTSLSFNKPLIDGKGYISVHPEMYPVRNGLSPSGNYYVYVVHEQYGSTFFRIHQEDDGSWACDNKPPFVGPGMLTWIGTMIEIHNEDQQ